MLYWRQVIHSVIIHRDSLRSHSQYVPFVCICCFPLLSLTYTTYAPSCQADPCCEWAVLALREEELPVSVLLPSHLADAHHHVRMLAAMSVERWVPTKWYSRCVCNTFLMHFMYRTILDLIHDLSFSRTANCQYMNHLSPFNTLLSY